MPAAKCQYCQKEVNKKEAFKVVVSGKNKYWCDEDCYKNTQSIKLERIRTAKCQICGTKVNTKSAFKITNSSGQNKYYCSEQEWKAEEERKKKAKEDKDRVYYLICDMWGYEIQNTRFFDEWAKWNKLKSNEIIYKYIRENETYLQQICDRLDDDENRRIMYFSAILKNSLRDFKPKPKVEEKPKVVVAEAVYETKYKSKSRTALEDLEEDCNE